LAAQFISYSGLVNSSILHINTAARAPVPYLAQYCGLLR
jgi:hypothetical protein